MGDRITAFAKLERGSRLGTVSITLPVAAKGRPEQDATACQVAIGIIDQTINAIDRVASARPDQPTTPEAEVETDALDVDDVGTEEEVEEETTTRRRPSARRPSAEEMRPGRGKKATRRKAAVSKTTTRKKLAGKTAGRRSAPTSLVGSEVVDTWMNETFYPALKKTEPDVSSDESYQWIEDRLGDKYETAYDMTVKAWNGFAAEMLAELDEVDGEDE